MSNGKFRLCDTVECSRTGHVIGFDCVNHMVRGLGVWF
jgi:hypothetical protein